MGALQPGYTHPGSTPACDRTRLGNSEAFRRWEGILDNTTADYVFFCGHDCDIRNRTAFFGKINNATD